MLSLGFMCISLMFTTFSGSFINRETVGVQLVLTPRIKAFNYFPVLPGVEYVVVVQLL